jgi:hypothetical protein
MSIGGSVFNIPNYRSQNLLHCAAVHLILQPQSISRGFQHLDRLDHALAHAAEGFGQSRDFVLA